MALRPDLLPALAAFESAARHQNFAHAARGTAPHRQRGQPPRAQAGARLGVALFQRHARGVSLTAEGRQLADAASSAMADMEACCAACAASGDDAPRAHHHPALADLHLAAAAPAALRRAHPQHAASIDTEVALTRFDDGGPDLGIRHGPGHWPGLTAHHLMDDALFPVASPRCPGIDGISERGATSRGCR